MWQEPNFARTDAHTAALGLPRRTAWLALITAAGAVLRFIHLDRQPLWLDEATDAAFAQRPFWECIFAEAVHPPLYRSLLHGLVSLFGDSDFVLRLLPALFGIAAIPAAALLARKLHPPSELFAAVLTATSPFLIYFSQENRNYSLFILLAIVSTLTFLRVSQSRHAIPLYGVLSILLLYTHYLSVFVLFAHEIIWWLYVRRNWKSWLGARVLVTAAYAPWLLWAAEHYNTESRLFMPLFMFVPDAMVRFFAGFGVGVFNSTESAPSRARMLSELLVIVPALMLFLWLLWRGSKVLASKASAAALFVALVPMPWIILYALAPWLQLSSVRYVAFQAPFLLILAGLGLSSLGRKRLAVSTALGASVGFYLLAYYAAPGEFLGYRFRYAKEDWRDAAAFVRLHSPDAVVISPDYLSLALNRYPLGAEETLAVAGKDLQWQRFRQTPERMAVVTGRMGPAQEDLLRDLDLTYSRVAEATFPSQNLIQVVIYRRRSPEHARP